MPQLNGIEATRQIVRRLPDVHVLILSMHADEAYVTQILQAGATGYLLKDSADVDLMQAVSEVAQGRSFFSPSIAKVMLDDYVRQLAAKDLPPAVADRAFLRLIYGEHPYGHLAIGTEAALRTFRPERIAEFHGTTFRPERSTLVVAGPMSHDRLLAVAAAAFSAWPDNGPAPETADAASLRAESTPMLQFTSVKIRCRRYRSRTVRASAAPAVFTRSWTRL